MIWDKNNIFTPEFSGEFVEYDKRLGDSGEHLIKFPNCNFSNDMFFRLHFIGGSALEFISDKPVVDGLKAYYQIEIDSDENMPIEIYDSDSKKLINTIIVKDLYQYWWNFNDDFMKNDNSIAVIFIQHDAIEYIGQIKMHSGFNSMEVIPMFGYLSTKNLKTYFDSRTIKALDVKFEILESKESIIDAFTRMNNKEKENYNESID